VGGCRKCKLTLRPFSTKQQGVGGEKRVGKLLVYPDSPAPGLRAGRIVEKLVETGDLGRLDRLAAARRVIADERPLHSLEPGGPQCRIGQYIPAEAQLWIAHSEIECPGLLGAFAEPVEGAAQGEPQTRDRNQITVEPQALVIGLKGRRKAGWSKAQSITSG